MNLYRKLKTHGLLLVYIQVMYQPFAIRVVNFILIVNYQALYNYYYTMT